MPIIESELMMWVLIAVVLCIVFLVYTVINRKFLSKLRSRYSAELINEISFFQHLNLLIFSVLSAVIILVFFLSSSQIKKLNRQLEELTEVISINKKTEVESNVDSNTEVDSNTAKDEVVDFPELPEEMKNYYPPVIENNDVPDDVSSETAPPAPVELKPQNTIQDIFGDDHSNKSANDIKTRYEELLATYLLMKKCDKAGKDDYKIIMASLQKEITDIGSPMRLQYDTLVAAKGSYDELYSRNDCSKPSLTATIEQYNSYILSLSKILQK